MREVKRFRKTQNKPFVYPQARIWALIALRDFLAFSKGSFFWESFSVLRSSSYKTSWDVILVTSKHKTKKSRLGNENHTTPWPPLLKIIKVDMAKGHSCHAQWCVTNRWPKDVWRVWRVRMSVSSFSMIYTKYQADAEWILPLLPVSQPF